jgi:hypothetical protein
MRKAHDYDELEKRRLGTESVKPTEELPLYFTAFMFLYLIASCYPAVIIGGECWKRYVLSLAGIIREVPATNRHAVRHRRYIAWLSRAMISLFLVLPLYFIYSVIVVYLAKTSKFLLTFTSLDPSFASR